MFKLLVEKWKRRKRAEAIKQFRNQLKHILHLNDDILVASTKDKVREIIAETETVDTGNAGETEKFLDRAPLRVVKILPRKTFPTLREYADILAVAFTVAFGARALYVQPFKIPTGSMQPTLYGIHYISSNDTISKFPAPLRYPLFSAGKTDPQGNLLNKGWYSQGDHLFVDRYSHHITGLDRGDIVVFNTEGIVDPVRRNKLADKGYYYIKRLVGLPGDSLKIVDKKLYVKPAGENEVRPVTDFSPKFDKLYSGKGGYQGHRSEDPFLAGDSVYQVPPDSYFMMGDNTMFSYDSRFWGPVPRRNIVGRASVIFWPFSRRWGAVDRQPPLDVPTGVPDLDSGRFSSMTLQ